MKKWLANLLLLIAGGYFCFPPQANSSTNSIMKVQIAGLNKAEGQICYSLFDRGKGFPGSSNNLEAKCISISGRLPILTIEDLHLGTYAIAVFHDVNGDGELNRNFLGIPQEGFGFSQNPEIQTSPPSFGESAVLVTGAETNLQIQLRYF